MSTVDLWTIDDLGVRVALTLSDTHVGAQNGRVREVPDRRTIRYYTTLGLLDRPAEMRGRTALYGRRHLLQLVAIKRLQARGLSLAEVQQQLIGLPDRELERLAQLVPSDKTAGRGGAATAKADDRGSEVLERRSQDFWSAPPAPPPPVAASPRPAAPLPLQGVPLDDLVTLLLPAARPLDDDDVQTIRTVAAPLLRLLEKRRLICRPDKGSNDVQNHRDPQ